MRRDSSVQILTAAALTAAAALTGSVCHARTSTEPPAAEVALHGSGATVPACASCHGQTGEGNAAAGFPRLAGLSDAYLAEQLDGFANGSRSSAVMEPVAKALSKHERVELARYYSQLPVPNASQEAVAETVDDGLALHGRWSDGIPACVNCHGDGGSGVGSRFPPLAGQSSLYIANQLRAWKAGARGGDPLGLMRAVADRLSDQDISEVSAYFAAQSPTGELSPTEAQSGAQSPAKSPPTPSTQAAPQPEAAPPAKSAGSSEAGHPGFTPADGPIPDDEFGKVVTLGRNIFEDPARYASQYIGNDLSCTNCHLDAGRRVGSAPLWAAYVSYPAYRTKNHHVNTFEERVQGCFRFSMNGKAPPLGDPILVAIESYAYWMARGAPLDPNIAGRGYPRPPKPALSPNYERGKQVFARTCALCHGGNGEGARAGNDSPAFPALWGPDSFNWGAGMGSVTNAASFIKANMPFGLGGTLSDQDAWDVALYMDSHERPQDPRYTGSVADTRERFHDSDDWMYGRTVDGHLLGSDSVAPGPRPHGQAPSVGVRVEGEHRSP